MPGAPRRGDAAPGLRKSLVKAFNDLRCSIAIAEDMEDARAVALLYTTVQHALPGAVNPEYRQALRRVLEAINWDGAAMMAKVRKSRH